MRVELDGDVRLVRGHNETSGVVEVFLQKKWMEICDRSTWTANDAAVICRQLGVGRRHNFSTNKSQHRQRTPGQSRM